MFMILIYNNKLDVVLLHRLSTTDFHNLKETFEKLVLSLRCGRQICVAVKGLAE